jgi:outer membrane lipoprotein-sorting protein
MLASFGRRSDRARRRLAWAVPLGVAAAVAAGVAAATATSSAASPTLPHRTAEQLLVAAQTTNQSAFSGTVHESAHLGIPALPGDVSGTSLSWQSLITGSHTARVWADGPAKQRLALLGELAEADVIHNGRDVWTYTSETNTVTHTVLRAPETATPNAETLSPDRLARQLLSRITPSTQVSVDATRTVAGRAAYTLVLQPRDNRSTVREVAIAIDGRTFLPLQVQVFSSGSAPAIQVGFTHISYATPAQSVFAFHVPAGAHVQTNAIAPERRGRFVPRHRLPIGPARNAQMGPYGHPAMPQHPMTANRMIGSGWTAVFELANGADAMPYVLQRMTTDVGNSGERLLHTALVNAVILPDGRVFVGAVTPALLEHVAATSGR